MMEETKEVQKTNKKLQQQQQQNKKDTKKDVEMLLNGFDVMDGNSNGKTIEKSEEEQDEVGDSRYSSHGDEIKIEKKISLMMGNITRRFILLGIPDKPEELKVMEPKGKYILVSQDMSNAEIFEGMEKKIANYYALTNKIEVRKRGFQFKMGKPVKIETVGGMVPDLLGVNNIDYLVKTYQELLSAMPFVEHSMVSRYEVSVTFGKMIPTEEKEKKPVKKKKPRRIKSQKDKKEMYSSGQENWLFKFIGGVFGIFGQGQPTTTSLQTHTYSNVPTTIPNEQGKNQQNPNKETVIEMTNRGVNNST